METETNKIKLSKYLIFAASLTIFSIFVHIVTVSYNNLIGPIQQAKDNPLIKPLPQDFDPQVLDQIDQKTEYLAAPTPQPTENIEPSL